MKQRNVTLSLPDDVLREARHLAVDHGLSLSRYLSLLLEEQVESARQYRAARDRQLRLLEHGLNLGTQGKVTWTREELHER
ncbi:MAG: CopG family transcriptional regulator [Chloroflexota bacterium]|nr:MAG: CopG family transcriptional regulator [Chloroflexota bacterium]